jgi:hypothetical protein
MAPLTMNVKEGEATVAGCNPCQHWNQGGHHGSGKFKGKTKEIEGDTFDNTGPHNAAIFNKSLNNIANYLQLNHGNDVSKAVHNMKLANIILPDIPQHKPDPTKLGEPIPISKIYMYLWKKAHTKASECKEKYDKNIAKAYIIIYHQFSPYLKNVSLPQK